MYTPVDADFGCLINNNFFFNFIFYNNIYNLLLDRTISKRDKRVFNLRKRRIKEAFH